MYRPRIAPSDPQNTLDDLVTRNVLTMLKATGPNLAPQAAQTSPSQDLVPDLVRKVMQLEADNNNLQEQLQQYQWPCQNAKAGHAQQPQEQPKDHQQQIQHLQLELQRLRQQCKESWQQVADMKQSLNDYGLVWVGDTGQAASPTVSPEPAAAGGCTELPFDVAELQECLDELNRVAGDGIAKLQQVRRSANSSMSTAASTGGARTHTAKVLQLCTPEAVKLAVYKDGLQLHTAAPVLYTSIIADSVLVDVFDGYFPSVLKHEFPDGTPIQLVDRTNMTLAEAAAAAATARATNIRGFQENELESSLLSGPIAGNVFLGKLPKTVIRNQNVVPVRLAVAEYIRPSSSSSNSTGSETAAMVACETQQADNGSDGTAVAGCEVDGRQQQLTIIQVKSEDGKQTYVLQLPASATIATLRASIDRHRSGSGFICQLCRSRTGVAGAAASLSSAALAYIDPGVAKAPAGRCSYELRSSFPACLYDDASMSLKTAGLTPSATLFMRHKHC